MLFASLFALDFVRMAFCATLLLSITCGLLSPVVVLKQRSYLGDTLAHLVFPGVVLGIIASQYLNFSPWALIIIGATTTALLGTFIAEGLLKKLAIPPDSAAVVCLTTFFAAGIVLISSQKGVKISPENIFFGDILTLNNMDIIVILTALIVVALAIIPLKKHWDAWLVDTEFAQIAGFKVNALNKLFPLLLTITVLAGLFAAGGLMICALITMPALLYHPRSVFSPAVVLLSIGLGLAGLVLAFALNWPVGPTIVLVGFACLCTKAVFSKK